MSLDPQALIAQYGWHLGTFVYASLSGIIPVLNCEVFLLFLVAAAPRDKLASLIVTTTVGQMVAKSLLYWGGRGVVRLPARYQNVLASFGCTLGAGWKAPALVFTSAVIGVPPFYAMSIACGALRWSFLSFLLFGTLGRLVRFSMVLLVPPGFGKGWLPDIGPWGMGAVVVVIGLLLCIPLIRRARSKEGVATVNS